MELSPLQGSEIKPFVYSPLCSVFCQIDPSRGTIRSLISDPSFRIRLIAACEYFSLSIDDVNGLGLICKVLIAKLKRNGSHFGPKKKKSENTLPCIYTPLQVLEYIK